MANDQKYGGMMWRGGGDVECGGGVVWKGRGWCGGEGVWERVSDVEGRRWRKGMGDGRDGR